MPLTNTERYTLMKAEKATKLAKRLNKEDDKWSYQAVHDPAGTGLSYIHVYDEKGYNLGKL